VLAPPVNTVGFPLCEVHTPDTDRGILRGASNNPPAPLFAGVRFGLQKGEREALDILVARPLLSLSRIDLDWTNPFFEGTFPGSLLSASTYLLTLT